MADNLEEIYCPACGKKMKKIFMPSQGINLDVCTDGCGGIYFDNREFLKFDENKEDIGPLEEVFKNKTFKKVNDTDERICPVCGQKMVKNYSSSKHQITVDDCYGCGGKFLDHSELEKIRDEYNSEEERASDVLCELYQTIGTELDEVKAKYQKSQINPSLLTRFIKLKY